jgi:hypothetical protein
MTGGQSAVRMNDRHSFPVGGLVELSRATYQSTPLAVVEIRPTVFSFIGAGGTVTAVGGSQECAVIDTGYGPRVPEIRSAIAWALHESPRWLMGSCVGVNGSYDPPKTVSHTPICLCFSGPLWFTLDSSSSSTDQR